jgi:flavodoxin
MKKVSALILAILTGISLAACESIDRDTIQNNENSTVNGRQYFAPGQDDQTGSKAEGDNNSRTEGNNILVAYFSHSGNTREIANQIHERVGGDILEIVTVNPYPVDYDEVVDQARKEQADDYRPELATDVENMNSYDVVFVGYPNWFETMPMAVFSFLEEYDFSGKTIAPFCTHEGSRLGRSVEDIKRLCPQSTILDGLAIKGGDVKNAQDEVSDWLRELEMIE